MRAVLQRVKKASLKVDGQLISETGAGMVIFLGIGQSDNEAVLDKMVEKICKLRIFEDEQGKMNLSVIDTQGQILLVSQFTLYADCSHGNRPSFLAAEKPERAKELYENALQRFCQKGIVCKPGVFGADMKIDALNDGPVTIVLDSSDLK